MELAVNIGCYVVSWIAVFRFKARRLTGMPLAFGFLWATVSFFLIVLTSSIFGIRYVLLVKSPLTPEEVAFKGSALTIVFFVIFCLVCFIESRRKKMH